MWMLTTIQRVSQVHTFSQNSRRISFTWMERLLTDLTGFSYYNPDPSLLQLASKIINKDKSNSPKRIKSEPTVTVRIDTSPKSRERKLQRKSRSRSRSPSPKLKKSVKDRLGDKLSSTEAAEADPPTFKSSHWGSKSRLGKEQRNGRSSPKNSKSM